MTLRNKSVLVAGGAGFIGSHLVDAILKEGPDEIVVVDNLYLGKKENLPNGIRLYIENVSDYNTMKNICALHDIDIVFNLAVVPLPVSLEKPGWTFRQNIDMMLSLCELARNDCFHTMIHFSSSEAYGSNVSSPIPMREDHPLNGTTTYAASKAASDLLLMSYVRTFGIDAAIIRPFNNYGPRQNEGSYAGVIPLTINRIMKGEAPVIFGDGKQTRDYLFVSDTTRAAIEIYNKKVTRGKVLNIASGVEISIEDVIRKIADVMNYNGEIKYEPERIGDVRRHIANIYLAEDLIGFKPTTSFDEGIRKTVEWYCRGRKMALCESCKKNNKEDCPYPNFSIEILQCDGFEARYGRCSKCGSHEIHLIRDPNIAEEFAQDDLECKNCGRTFRSWK